MRKFIFVGCCNFGKYVIVWCTIFACICYNTGYNLTFLPGLQVLCPYTSFCGESARLKLPENETKQSCCKACSCEPECEMFGNCCFDYVRKDKVTNLRQCMSPVATEFGEENQLKYMMVYSCQSKGESNVLCPFTRPNISSFAPVVSTATGEIYVNQQCAECNDVTDGVAWRLSVNCPFFEEDYFLSTSELFVVNPINRPACYLMHVPPASVNVEPRKCSTGIIRQCNVTELVTQRTPMWDYCPMFNATYIHYFPHQVRRYSNIFCFLCNHDIMPGLLCRELDSKGIGTISFSAMLDEMHFTGNRMLNPHHDGECGAASVMVRSFKSECRKVICPLGQFRVEGHCGYYSKTWIGGSFTVLLKLTPVKGTAKLDVTFVLRSERNLNDATSKWLKRNAMRDWNLEVLYNPTTDKDFVEYFLIMATYPDPSVNPSYLQDTIKQTLEEIWHVEIDNAKSKFKVEMNEYQKYSYISREDLKIYNITIDQPYAYVNELMIFSQELKPDIQSHILFDAALRPRYDVMINVRFINKLFFCEQIELNEDEYDRTLHEIFFKVTNITLYASDYTLSSTASVRVCLSQFPANRGHSNLWYVSKYAWFSFLIASIIMVNFAHWHF